MGQPQSLALDKAREAELGRTYLDAVSRILQAHGHRDGTEPDRIRFGDAYFVSRWVTAGKRHCDDTEAIPARYDVLERFYGRGTTPMWIERGSRWSKKEQRTKTLKPVRELRGDLIDMTTASNEGRLVRLDDSRKLKEVRAKRLAVVMKRRHGRHGVDALHGFQVAREIEIDVSRMHRAARATVDWIAATGRWAGRPFGQWLDALESGAPGLPDVMREEMLVVSRRALRDHAFEHKPAHQLIAERLEIVRRCLVALPREATAGKLEQRYHEAPNGRIYGAGTGSLMNVPKVVRQIALHGCVEYDVHACHFAIFEHLGRTLGATTDVVSDFVEHKQRRREELAGRIGRPIEDAKDIIAAVGFGASVSEDPEHAGMLQRKYDDVPGIGTDMWLRSLRIEVREIARQMLAQARREAYAPTSSTIRNCRGLHMPWRADALQRAAFILQGIEAAMLEAALRAHTVGLQEPLLALHDAWVVRESLDPEDAVASIRAATKQCIGTGIGIGVRLNVTEYRVSGL